MNIIDYIVLSWQLLNRIILMRKINISKEQAKKEDGTTVQK